MLTEERVCYNFGFTRKGDWVCRVCGTIIGRNLLGQKPYALAHSHTEHHPNVDLRAAINKPHPTYLKHYYNGQFPD